MSNPLRLICVDIDAPPLFGRIDNDGFRQGFEPTVGMLLADWLGRALTWIVRPWDDMIPAVQAGHGDGILCGQGIIASRLEQVDFTSPYAVFDESVLVRSDDPIKDAEGLHGRRVAAIAGSANFNLAETFAGAHLVAFDGGTDDVLADMISALRSGEVDAVVDDDVALVPIAQDPAFTIAFTAPTHNPWGIGVSKQRPDTLATLNNALTAVRVSGALEKAWTSWMPALPYPFERDV